MHYSCWMIYPAWQVAHNWMEPSNMARWRPPSPTSDTVACREPTPHSAAIRNGFYLYVLLLSSPNSGHGRQREGSNVQFEHINWPACSSDLYKITGMCICLVFCHLLSFESCGDSGSAVDTSCQLPGWYWCSEVIPVFKWKWITCGLSTTSFPLSRTTWRFSAYLCLDCPCACPLLIPANLQQTKPIRPSSSCMFDFQKKVVRGRKQPLFLRHLVQSAPWGWTPMGGWLLRWKWRLGACSGCL